MDVDPAISAVSQYLRSEIGIDNRAELMRIVDITMNTNSIYKVALPGPRSGPRGSPNTLVSAGRVRAHLYRFVMYHNHCLVS